MSKKILFVVDNPEEAPLTQIFERLERNGDYITRTKSLNEFSKLASCFDLIVISGKLGGENNSSDIYPSIDEDLLELKNDYPYIPKILITTNPESIDSEEKVKQVLMSRYSLADVIFINSFSEIKYLKRKISAAINIQHIIITPLQEEFDAVINKFDNKRKVNCKQYAAYHTEINNCQILIVKQARMGQSNAAALVTLLCSQYTPESIFLVGIAGGKEGKVRLANIIIADVIIDITLGAVIDGKRKSSPMTFNLDDKLLGSSKSFAKSYKEKHKLKFETTVHHAPMLSSSDVIRDEEVIKEYADIWGKVAGVEMEAGGIVNTISDYVKPSSPAFLMIRGVSDFAGKDKDKDNEQHREQACEAAADYAHAFLEHLCQS